MPEQLLTRPFTQTLSPAVTTKINNTQTVRSHTCPSWLALGSVALLATALPAWSQVTGEEAFGSADLRSDSRPIDTVTITARQSLAQRFLSTGSMVTVNRRDIEQLGADSVGDVLRQLPGVQTTPSANGGLEIRMRGMDRNATQILIDGQRVSSASSQLPFDQLPAELIERIEVVRAPTAEHAGATGGTINLVLRQATAQRETNVRITDNHVWGRHAGQIFFSKTGAVGAPAPALDTRKLLAESDKNAQPGSARKPADAPSSVWSYFVAASNTQQLLGANSHRQTLANGALLSESDNSTRYKRSELALIPRLNGKLSSQDQITVRATLNRSHLFGNASSTGSAMDTAHGAYSTSYGEVLTRQRNYTQLGVDWTHRFKDSKWDSSLSTSRAADTVNRDGASTLDYAPPSTNAYAFADDRRERMWQLSSKLTGTKSDLLWMFGFEFERRQLSVDNTHTLGSAPTVLSLDAGTERRVLWAQNEWELPAKTTLTAGLRWQHLQTRSIDPTLLQDQQRQFVQPSVHTRTPLGEDMQWRFNAARVTRNPNVWDLLNRSTPSQGSNSINNPDSLGNPQLRSEVANTFDTGLERKLGSSGQMGTGVFVRQLNDAIATRTALIGGRWSEQRSNVGNATVWGIEADAKTGLTALGLGSDWTLSTNASVLQSRMTTGDTVGGRIPGQARYLANVNVAKPLRRTGGWFGGASLSLVGAADLDTSAGLSGTDLARRNLDLYVGRVIPKLGYWRLGIYNIGNAKYIKNRYYSTASSGAAGSATAYQDNSNLTFTPRLYLTVGTQF